MPPSNQTAQRGTAAQPRAVSTPLSPARKSRSLSEVMLTAKHCELAEDDADDADSAGGKVEVPCEECGNADGKVEMLLCDEYDQVPHLLPPPHRPRRSHRLLAPPLMLPRCSSYDPGNTKLVDFFRLQKCSDPGGGRSKSPLDNRKRRWRSASLARHKTKRKLLPFTPSEDPRQRLEQVSSLATALKASNMEFSDELTYMRGMAPLGANKACLEGGMQILSKEDKETLDICKSMVKRGECPQLMVVFDSCEGLEKDLTLRAEYTVDVDYLTNREHDDCDSLMSLLLSIDVTQSLVICPDKRGNITRIINGINHHNPEGGKKQNVKCVRYNVEGESLVLLVA